MFWERQGSRRIFLPSALFSPLDDVQDIPALVDHAHREPAGSGGEARAGEQNSVPSCGFTLLANEADEFTT